MKELILENIGIIFYLIGCLVVIILFATKKSTYRFEKKDIAMVLLSWVTIVATLFILRDKHYKSIEK